MLSLKNRSIGSGYPAFIIAEIGSNHNGDKKVVKRLIDIACEAEFDAVKFQTYEPQEIFSAKITTRDVNYEQIYGYKPWWEIARDYILMPRDWFKEMFDYARKKGLFVFSTVHSVKDAEFIMQFDPPVFKVASMDINYIDFLKRLAKFNKPVLLSTGMSYAEEIEEAVRTVKDAGNNDIALLHCISCYSPDPEYVNLRNIVSLREKFNIPIGFSDHSSNNYMAMASVALGACIIEKHVTLDRGMKGPDHSFALTPDLMRELVFSIREIEKGLVSSDKGLSEAEAEMRKKARRSIVARRTIKKGEIIGKDMLKITRPGIGIEPKYADSIIGKRIKVDVHEENLITWKMIDEKG